MSFVRCIRSVLLDQPFFFSCQLVAFLTQAYVDVSFARGFTSVHLKPNFFCTYSLNNSHEDMSFSGSIMSVQPNQTFPSFSSLNDSFLRGRELHMKYHVCTINQTFPALSSLNKSFTRGREPRKRHHVCTIKPNFSPHFVALMTHSMWA